MSMMTVKDLEKLQATLNQAGKETLTVYRPTGEESVLGNGDILTIPELGYTLRYRYR